MHNQLIDKNLIRQHVAFVRGTNNDNTPFYAPYFSLKSMDRNQYVCILPTYLKIGSTLQFKGSISCSSIHPVKVFFGLFQITILTLKNETLQQVDVIEQSTIEKRDHTFLSAYMSENHEFECDPVSFKFVGDSEKETFHLANSKNNAPIFVSHDILLGVTLFNGKGSSLLNFPPSFTTSQRHSIN